MLARADVFSVATLKRLKRSVESVKAGTPKPVALSRMTDGHRSGAADFYNKIGTERTDWSGSAMPVGPEVAF